MGIAAPLRAQALFDASFANPNLNGQVNAIAVQGDGKILVGGSFTTAGPSDDIRNRLARFNTDGTLDSFAPNVNGAVRTIAVQADGRILIGGDFTTVAGQTRNRLARLNVDGTVDSFDPGANQGINVIAVQTDGQILVGGQFTTIAGQPRNYIARLNTDGTADSFNPNANSAVNAIAVQADGQILVGGQFTSMSGQARNRIARLDTSGNADGFDPNASGTVSAIAVQTDGQVLVGGQFTTIGGQTRNRIARLNTDGTADSFNPDANGAVSAITVQADGQVLVGGQFTTIGGWTRTNQARLGTDGSPDSSYPNQNLDGEVLALALNDVGNLLVGGAFQTAGPSSAPQLRLARIFSGYHGLTLSRSGTGTGTVTSDVGGLACGSTCSAQFGNGTRVILTATPAAGDGFTGWSGGCSGTVTPLTVTVLANTTCTANFAPLPPTPTPAPSGPAPLPSFVATPLPALANMPAGGSASGSVSFAGSFVNPQGLTFTATSPGGGALPSWLTFDPATATFRYTAPLPADLPFQPVADMIGRAGATAANTIYPPLVRVAQVPVALTVTGAGQSYAATMQMSFYAPRPPVTASAVSLSLDGVPGNGRSGRSALSWDGGQVVFETAATNLLPASPNAHLDILRYHGLSGGRDRLSQTAIPGGGVANAADGASVNPAVSSDGRYAAFASDAPGVTLTPSGGKRQVYRTDLNYPRVALDGKATPAPDLVSATAGGVVGNGASDNPALSQDGRYVVFDSTATNFAAGLDGTRHVWRKDLATGALVQVAAGRTPAISWDGRWVAFEADGTVQLRDMTAESSQVMGRGSAPKLSARGDRMVFADGFKVMLGNRAIADGDQPDISADGRFVVYRSAAGQIVVHDIDRGISAPVTQTTTGASWNPAISGDGGTISFASNARALVPGNPAGGQLYLVANPLPLPGRTGYWYSASASGQGWAIERWGNQAYVGGLAYDSQGRGQWLAGFCNFAGLTCSGTLTQGPGFTLTDSTLTIGSAPAQALLPFPIGGARATGYAGLPQSGWWYDPAANDNVGYFLGISTQPQADGGVAHIGYLAVLAYDHAGRQVWQTAQATLAADLSVTGTLTQYAGGAPFGSAVATTATSGTAVGQVRMTFDGTDRALITLPSGGSTTLARFRF